MFDSVSPYLAGRAKGMLAILILAVGGLFGYAIHQRNVVNRLTAANNQMVSVVKDTRAQIGALTSKLDSMAAAQQARQQEASNAGEQYVTPLKQNSRRSKHHPAGDPRFRRIQKQLDAQGRAIESTRQELASARADLGGSIARTHEELVVLEKKGERNYYEFDLDKSKQFQRTGPVGISLRKANTKHMYADLELKVDDAQLSKKHVNLFEPVSFYLGDEHRAVELVINSVRKNHIHGYISAPKYSASELSMATADNSRDNTGSSSGMQPADSAARQRRKLALPR
jgi:outer membrane murein-binding lipoprotein Lpp